jgi:hypothetical protein
MAKKKKSTKRNAVRRRESAVACMAERAKRSPAQQIAVLDGRFGVGQGAKKERARLQKQLEAKVKTA